MRGFVNNFNGADFTDVHGWAVHLRQQFPERQDTIDAALQLPMPDDKRQIAIRRIVEAQIDALLCDASTQACRPSPSRPDDPARAAARALARVGDSAIEHYARRISVTVAEARQKLLDKLSGKAGSEK